MLTAGETETGGLTIGGAVLIWGNSKDCKAEKGFLSQLFLLLKVHGEDEKPEKVKILTNL